MNNLFSILKKLEDKNIFYKLARIRDSVLIEVVVPGERWEIEVFEDGHLEIEKFISSGDIYDEKEISNLLKSFEE
ncbi:hypothetical protein SAMN00017477_1883 [Peptoniphilus asaccharolyticus DSM 20463]|uniref:Uncharacterized protein n=1 Tax=Peptoniphilus asaccharolyticus DSM 20463 TaxID=573058 RepID=A0A1W1VF97_PEPAS|nr:hypothetical protein [Peptoniphilus asaccharolyticus]MBL7575892.1 hypothetical protein [Peptoniphilus asaccharolyticus]SMB92038.1 hypothetical protein SAMN00017477_1883 [Peptoniphilus asaccharolyticus DSM 20463]